MAEKKISRASIGDKRHFVVDGDTRLSYQKKCELVSLSRSSFYYKPTKTCEEDLQLMKIIDEIHTKYSFFGSRRITNEIRTMGWRINRKKVQRLFKIMGIETAYPKRKKKNFGNEKYVYPYLLNDFCPLVPNEVWCSDITYIPTQSGYFYLTAVMDWHSRYVLSWELSNSLETDFCIQALEQAFKKGTPRVFNTDQGCQFSSRHFTELLLSKNILISMAHQGKCYDNIFIERLWRTLKYEDVYLKNYVNGLDAYESIDKYFCFYNGSRRHTALQNKTPMEKHFGCSYVYDRS